MSALDFLHLSMSAALKLDKYKAWALAYDKARASKGVREAATIANAAVGVEVPSC